MTHTCKDSDEMWLALLHFRLQPVHTDFSESRGKVTSCYPDGRLYSRHTQGEGEMLKENQGSTWRAG